MQVYMMAAISYVRYDILNRQLDEKSISDRVIFRSTLISLFLSLFWSAVPIFGWSKYSLEDGLVSCSVEYNEKSLNVITYNVGMFTFVFFLPFAIIIVANVKSLFIVYNLISINCETFNLLTIFLEKIAKKQKPPHTKPKTDFSSD